MISLGKRDAAAKHDERKLVFSFFFSYSLFVMGFLACFGGDEQEQEDEFKMLRKKCGVAVGNFFFMLNEE